MIQKQTGDSPEESESSLALPDPQEGMSASFIYQVIGRNGASYYIRAAYTGAYLPRTKELSVRELEEYLERRVLTLFDQAGECVASFSGAIGFIRKDHVAEK